MKYIIKIISVITILIFTTSCKDNVENKDTSPKVEESTETKQPEEHHHETGVVQLNDGKKWEANLETTDGIKKMQEIMTAFTDKESPKAYISLKENLETEFTTIFEKCTMKGESHNQLHNYLKPMLGLFDGLITDDINTRKKSFETINKHLSHYSNYFK